MMAFPAFFLGLFPFFLFFVFDEDFTAGLGVENTDLFSGWENDSQVCLAGLSCEWDSSVAFH